MGTTHKGIRFFANPTYEYRINPTPGPDNPKIVSHELDTLIRKCRPESVMSEILKMYKEEFESGGRTEIGLPALFRASDVQRLLQLCEGKLDYSSVETEDLEGMAKVADYLTLPVELGMLQPPGKPGDKRTSECYHNASLSRLDRKFADARNIQNKNKASAALADYESGAWKEMVTWLDALTPSDPNEGAARAAETLRYERPSPEVLGRALSFRVKDNDICEPVHHVSKPRLAIDEPVINPRNTWGKNVPQELKDALRTCLEKLPRGGFALAGGAAVDAVYAGSHGRKPADFDVFVYNMDAEEANEALNMLIMAIGSSSNVHVTGHAVTIRFPCIDMGIVTMQVIRRLFKNPAQIITGFDLCACQVALLIRSDGEFDAIASPLAVLAMQKGVIYVDPDLQSETYAFRLRKYYLDRGFLIVVPLMDNHGLDINKVLSPELGGLAAIVRVAMCIDSPPKAMRDKVGRFSDYCNGVPLRYRLHTQRTPVIEGLITAFNNLMAREKIDRNYQLSWQGHDPMRQGPIVSGTFHPCYSAFYNCIHIIENVY